MRPARHVAGRSTPYPARGYFPGAEARVRYGLLLARLGRDAEARAWLAEVLTQLRRAPAHVQKAQRDWIVAAEKVMRA